MRILLAAVIIALLTGAAYSQGINMAPGDKPVDPAEEQKREEIDKAYKSAIQKMPAVKSDADPWGNVRGAAPAQNTQSKPRPGSK